MRITHVPPVPPRPDDAHKGTFGTVIVIGGCDTMMGAPALCASGALRSGTGLVKVAVPAAVLPVALAIEPAATGIILSEDTADSLHSLDQADPDERAVLAVGPGMGQSKQAGVLLEQLLQGNRPIVLDADGLNLLAATGKARPQPGPPLVMTPHPGEYLRLAKPLDITLDPTDPATRSAAAGQLASAHRCVVVLKGQHSIVSDGQRVYVNTTGNPSLATAGSGDVLTGVIASLIGQTMEPFAAAMLGVYLHGLASDLWAKQHGTSGLASCDLANLLPDAFQQHRHTTR